MKLWQKFGLSLGLGLALVAGAVQAQQAQFINILTGGQSGVYYPLGVALSQIYAKAIPNARATAQVTKASAENLNLLQAGRGELAFALGDAVSDAWKGDAEAGFKTKLDKLRTLGGFGYAKEYQVERYLREMLIPRVAPISPQLILCFIAEKVLGLPKSY